MHMGIKIWRIVKLCECSHHTYEHYSPSHTYRKRRCKSRLRLMAQLATSWETAVVSFNNYRYRLRHLPSRFANTRPTWRSIKGHGYHITCRILLIKATMSTKCTAQLATRARDSGRFLISLFVVLIFPVQYFISALVHCVIKQQIY